MAFNSLPDLSPERAYAHQVAARELAKYCQEFALWRRTKRSIARPVKSPRSRGLLVVPQTEKPDPPEPHSST